MAITAKPAGYTVDTGHAKCPDHFYALDEGTGTTAADAVGSLDLTLDTAGMWNTDATYGAVLRFASASSQKAISATTFAASSGLCMVFIAKSASATNPVANQYIGGPGSASAGIYGGVRFNTSGQVEATCDTGGATNGVFPGGSDRYDGSWHMLAVRSNDSTGSNGVTSLSVDGGAWSSNAGTGDQDLAQFTRIALGCTPQSSLNGFFDGDILAAFVYVDDYATWDDTWISELYDAPWAFLTTTTKYVKLLTEAAAASDTAVAGVVMNGSTYIGTFTGQAFEADLESGEAVLLVAASDITPDGTTLTTSDTPLVFAYNATDATSGPGTATVIEV